MKVLVTGSRAWTDYAAIKARLAQLPPGSIVVHGDARGADKLARLAAYFLGFRVRGFPADWKSHGLAAGPIRNQEMLEKEHLPEEPIELCLAWPQGKSKGTRDMMRRAEAAGIRVEVCSEVPA